jgi:hypothetical protein
VRKNNMFNPFSQNLFRGREVSRGGRGPYGFGNAEQEALDAEKDHTKTEEAAASENVDAAAEPEQESAEVADVEEEAPTLSYDDFMKKREESRASSLFAPKNVRTVNAATQFAGLTSKKDEEEEEERLKAAAQKKDQRSTQKTQVLDVSFKFESANNDQRMGGRGGRDFNRGGRGDSNHSDRDFSRGGRGRGNRGGRGQPDRRPRSNNVPAQLNSGDFPSL